jgi:hypothetical protein
MIKLTKSEKKILAKIKKALSLNHKPYDFCFVYNDKEEAIDYEGGTELPHSLKFRNEYRVVYGKQLIQNWSD